MLHLLTETSLFISLPNGCFCQMTGEPIVNVKPPVSFLGGLGLQTDDNRKRKASEATGDEPPTKRCKFNDHNVKPKKITPFHTSLHSDR